MGSVPEQEGATSSEMSGDPVVHVVRREPVHPLDLDAHAIDDALAHGIPAQRLMLIFGFLTHCADEPSTSALHRKDREKVDIVEGSVQFAVHG